MTTSVPMTGRPAPSPARSALQLAAGFAAGLDDPVAAAERTLAAIAACPDKAVFTAVLRRAPAPKQRRRRRANGTDDR